jgi:hypothetical protein
MRTPTSPAINHGGQALATESLCHSTHGTPIRHDRAIIVRACASKVPMRTHIHVATREDARNLFKPDLLHFLSRCQSRHYCATARPRDLTLCGRAAMRAFAPLLAQSVIQLVVR